MKTMTNLDEAKKLVDRGALFVVNHSGGKDSQAMMLAVLSVVPEAQVVVVHAALGGGVVWEGEEKLIRETVPAGIPIIVATCQKTLLTMVETRAATLAAEGRDASAWPSPTTRQCTSDLKRGPIEREVRHFIKERGLSGLVVNCMGLRAEESSNRAKATTWKFNERNSKAGREWYDWLPIHTWLETEVFGAIAEAGQKPHWCYPAGMRRCGCCFCIMASKSDLRCAAVLNPGLYRQYVELERRIGRTMLMPAKGKAPQYLEEALGLTVAEAEERSRSGAVPESAPGDTDQTSGCEYDCACS